MTKFISIFLLFCSIHVYSQCPEGPITLSSQEEVDAFILNWPDCQQMQNFIYISSDNEGEFIENLTGLSNLNYLRGLQIENFGFYNQEEELLLPGNLDGLANLDSLHFLGIYGTGFNKVVIESLEPLNQLKGWMGQFELKHCILNNNLPDFNELDSIGTFELFRSNGFTSTPLFENLEQLGAFTVIGDPNSPDSLQTVRIPSNLTDVSYTDGNINPYYSIGNNDNLVEIIGGENLTKMSSLEIFWNPLLVDISAFDNVDEISFRLELTSCREEHFQFFRNLSKVFRMSLAFNYDVDNILPCENSTDNLEIKIGESVDSLVIEDMLFMSINLAEEINFQGNLRSVGEMEFRIKNCTSFNGFEELSVQTKTNGKIRLITPGFPQLPNFESLETIAGELEILLDQESTLQNLTGLDNLNYARSIDIKGFGENSNSSFESLSGLGGLDSIDNKLQIKSLAAFSDYSAINSLNFVKRIEFEDLPALNSTLLFDDITVAITIEISNTGIIFLPQFTNLDSLMGLTIVGNEFLIDTYGLSDLEHISGNVVISDNQTLNNITFGNEVGLQGNLILTNNPSLENCGDSPTICSLISTAESSTVNNNGFECESSAEILNSCALSVSDNSISKMVIYPNPVINEFSIQGLETGTLEILDLNGRSVLKSKTLQEVDVSSLQSGLYIVRIRSGQAHSQIKLFKL
jgi:hypothetical protein